MNMPNLDKTGPRGAGPMTGRGLGRGVRNFFRRGFRNRMLGSNVCTCSKCGLEVPHKRGVPCSEVKCPKCNTLLSGVNCL